MKKLLFLISTLILFVGCSLGDSPLGSTDDDLLYFDLDTRLTEDSNGYYHLTLSQGSWQTLHRFSGTVTDSEGQPVDVVKFGWASSHYWYLTDTLGYIVNRGVNDEGQYVSRDTSYIVGFNGFEVPTINSASYSNADGEVNTMFAPVWSMKSDTVTVWVGFYNNDASLAEEYFKVVLD
ncbi:MAG: hypothetical protein QGH26_03610 [Candidatus Pacebacteria bacterium]|jgi:hypothetical protein|nr:hypothetical protein [Candidatus Paceibacterota bacterium]|tara:strand:+ start:101 stop:634 length:534 start_codon:yes stop_codon:yes gene_type:complete